MTTGSRAQTAALIGGITLLGLNLRPTVTSLPPVFPELQRDLGLSASSIAVLAAIPVLCFGVFASAAAPLSRRFGEEAVLAGALAVLAPALAVRGLLPGALLFPATAVAAAAIALMNVLLSSLIKRREPRHAGAILSVYLAALYVGAITATAIAVPLYGASGGSRFIALGLWSIPAAVAFLAWTPQLREREAVATAPPAASVRVLRHALAWQVSAFMGLQSLTYYATLSWLPALLRDRGLSAEAAGADLALTSVGGLVTALLVPVVAHRLLDQRVLVVPAIGASACGVAAALWMPLSTQVAWMLVLGLGQGASFALALYFTMGRAATSEGAASLSAMAQATGYLLATTGPLAVGLLHTATGAWTVPVALLLAVTAAQVAVGLLAARPLTVGFGAPAP